MGIAKPFDFGLMKVLQQRVGMLELYIFFLQLRNFLGLVTKSVAGPGNLGELHAPVGYYHLQLRDVRLSMNFSIQLPGPITEVGEVAELVLPRVAVLGHADAEYIHLRQTIQCKVRELGTNEQ